MPTNILIVGAGAIGAFYASRLALVPGLSVSVICRSNYKAVKANGFQVAVVDEPVHRHLGHAHQGRDLGHGEEAHSGEVASDRGDSPGLGLVRHRLTHLCPARSAQRSVSGTSVSVVVGGAPAIARVSTSVPTRRAGS